MSKLESATLLAQLWNAETNSQYYVNDSRAIIEGDHHDSITPGIKNDLRGVFEHLDVVALYASEGLLDKDHFTTAYRTIFESIKKYKYLDHFDKKEFVNIRKAIK